MESVELQAVAPDYDRHLADYGYNVINIHPSLVEFDLMTDSWTELVSPEMTARMQSLHAQVDFSDNVLHACSIFPFKHIMNVTQGRAAEAYFWKAAGRKDKKVVQNLLFPTSRHHLLMNRMSPVELPVPHVFDRNSTDLFRGNLDCGRLRDLLRDEAASVAYIYIEAENNASGGYPVSMANIREIHSIVSDYGIPMVLDATRVVENTVLIQRFEPGYSEKTLHDILHEFCSYFHSMTCSLAKDFGITRGGLIATNDEKLFSRARDTAAIFGVGINATDKGLINAALKDWTFIEQAINRRVDQSARIHAAMVKADLPVSQPAAGHCLLLDVADYLETKKYTNAIVAFTAWLYAQTGIRGGMHVTGMTREYAKADLVRFAVPLCTPDSRIDAMIEPFVMALGNVGQPADMIRTSNISGIYGQMHALYKPA